MNREEAITMLGQHIAKLEIAQTDPQIDPNEEEWQLLQDTKEEPKNCCNESRQATKQLFKKSLLSWRRDEEPSNADHCHP
jgi:hypothetical protein